PPPAAREAYALTPHGEALRPILGALARWGLRWMSAPKRGDHIEPEWVRLAAQMFAASGPTPARVFELRALACGDSPAASFKVAGGVRGTRIAAAAEPADASVAAPAALLIGLMSGAARARDLARAKKITVAGNASALADLPALFSMSSAQ
ncbi:MAG TPA: hypothetical protein VFT98_20020, partial [Myxococcota bacterium]|nr:hypothetical protein [Myxococcota bacterium]